MGQVRLASEKHLEVFVESAVDRAAIAAAFRATPGCDTFPLNSGQERFLINLENLSNVSALWACDFAWENGALEAVVNTLMPMAYRRAVMRATASEIRSQETPNRTRMAAE